SRQLEVRARVLGLEGRCFFLGHRREALELMAGFEILLVPALGEAFGRVLVEAMAVGTAVVASDSGGHGEIIEDGRTGKLVAADDPSALADGALALLVPGLRDDIVANARADVPRFYRARETSLRVQALYDEVLGAPESPVSALAAVTDNKLLRQILGALGARARVPVFRSDAAVPDKLGLAARIADAQVRRSLRRIFSRSVPPS
ncbi:MAG: glycosyltransferase, partial [Planctomycetes bacterium]|nr:glycosyltransferase [Planctomycetota bacterium]